MELSYSGDGMKIEGDAQPIHASCEAEEVSIFASSA